MKRHAIFAVLLLTALLIGACGGAAATPAPGGVAESRAPDAASNAQSKAGAPPAQPQAQPGTASVADRLIIKTASLSLTVKNTEQTLEAVKATTAALGGFISNSSTTRINKDQVRIAVTVRVPADKYDEALKAFKQGIIRVNTEKLGGQDVTEEYTDLNARLRNLEATEKELLALMTIVREKMQKAEDILAVQREINNVRAQIEQLKGRIQFLDRSVSLATITLDLVPEEVEVPVAQEGWDPLRVVRDALRSLVSALQVLINVLIYVVIFILPVVLVIGAPLVFIVRWLRRPRKPKTA